MAKQSELEALVAQQPRRKEFVIPMVADSTTEVAVDIDTDISNLDKVAWMILGVEYQFELIASPYTKKVGFVDAALDVAHVFQLAKGEAPATPVSYSALDNNLLLEDVIARAVITDGPILLEYPRKILRTCFTQQETLHALFYTTVDDTLISDTTIQLVGNIVYVPVTAPTARGESL